MQHDGDGEGSAYAAGSFAGQTVERVIDLTEVVGSDPAAVLLVELENRTVVFANDVAKQMAPGLPLPTEVDSWSDAAGLRDLDGGELSGSQHPLSLVAESLPVTGQAVSAARETELGLQREPLWVVAVPLSGAPQLEGHALVVFLRLADRSAAQDTARLQSELKERAILATELSFTMADASTREMPLVWVNPAFTVATGYSFDEVVGKNCRFLQGSGTDPEAPKQIRRAVDRGEAIAKTLLNYRKDGTAFWNHLSLSPITDADGNITHYVGIQTDVTGRVTADQDRDRALAAEQEARATAELSQRQLSLLAEATSQLAATLDVNESLERLASLVVPLLADWVVITEIRDDAGLGHIVARHRDEEKQTLVAEYATLFHAPEIAQAVARDSSMQQPARLMNDYASPTRRDERLRWVKDDRIVKLSDSLDAQSAMFIPLPGRDRIDAAMVLLRDGNSPTYTDQDLAVADDLGRRAGLILDNARLYQTEHRIAETLQRSLLPQLPEISSVRAAARYWASETGAAVGGDFYELIALRERCIGLAIGDVVGHDVYAAAAMGHLRGLLRACAWDYPQSTANGDLRHDPGKVLDRVDELMRGLAMSTMASAAYASFEPQPDGRWAMCHSSAGHPPMMVRHADGRVDILDDANGLLLGIQDNEHASAHRELDRGAVVIAYTDGLVEKRDESLQLSLHKLRDRIAAGPSEPEAICDHLLAGLEDSASDDVALIVLKLD